MCIGKLKKFVTLLTIISFSFSTVTAPVMDAKLKFGIVNVVKDKIKKLKEEVSAKNTANTETVQYSFGLIPLSPEDYEKIPMISAPPCGVAELPSECDISSNMPTPGNQGGQGSCTAWAVGYALKSYQEQVERNWGLSTSNHLFSPAYIYNQINGGQDAGSTISSALNILSSQGCASFITMPYNDKDYLTQPSVEAKTEAAKYKIVMYRRVNILDTSEMKRFLKAGYPVVIAMKVGENFLTYRLKNNSYVYSSLGEKTYGWHAVTVIGYNDNKQAFKFINSWSTSYGDNGYAWISYDFFPQVTAEGYWAQDYTESTEKKGALYVTSTPTGANIYLNDTFKGTTPLTISDLAVGDYILKVTKTGYTDSETTAKVVENQTSNYAITLSLPLPTTPILYDLSSPDTDGVYTVSWTVGDGATGYTLEEDDNSSFTSPTTVYTEANTSTNITGKTDGTYYYRVKATNSYGSSSWSSYKYITVNKGIHPDTPSLNSLSSPDTDGNYTVSWNSVTGADSYTLEEDDNSSFSSPTQAYSGVSTSKNISGKTNGTYYYRVKATNAYGDSEWSNSQYITVAKSPTTTTIYINADTDSTPFGDTWVNEDSKDTNYYSQVLMNVAFASSADVWYSGYLGIDLSGYIPTGSTINSATLYLYCLQTCTGGTAQVKIRQCQNDWDVNTITWNNRPTSFLRTLDTQPVSSTGWQYFSITQAVADWVANPSSNYGLNVSLDNDVAGYLKFYTSDNGVNSPYIVVNYTAP
ncbi:MAG: DNRLRE domain-containing protein [Elusimicrobiota bacterium]